MRRFLKKGKGRYINIDQIEIIELGDKVITIKVNNWYSTLREFKTKIGCRLYFWYLKVFKL